MPGTDYAHDPPTKPVPGRPARYTALRYPNWPHTGQPCNVVGESGGGLWVVFEGDPSRFIVSPGDLQYT
jgi:hypothetical protein